MIRTQTLIKTIMVMVVGVMTFALPTTSFASEAPVKEIIANHTGLQADSVAGGNAPAGNVYVLDDNNHRVQELSAEGKFIAMFGWDVNKTKENESAPQSERNICTQESGDTCQAGVEGTAPGQFTTEPESIAVDPTNNDFYVAERSIIYDENGEPTGGHRVQKFSAEGQFVLEIGKDVNETTGGNLCTHEEETAGTKCQGPSQEVHSIAGSTEPGAFGFAQFDSGLLEVGGPEDLLYVGEEHAVQEFRPNGTWAGEPVTKSETISTRLKEISPASGSYVLGIAVDKDGNTYLEYPGFEPTILEFDNSGKEIKEFTVPGILALAIDPAGRLGVITNDQGHRRGLLFEVGSTNLHRLTEFNAEKAEDISFNGNDDMYTAGKNSEVVVYRPVPVAELVTTTTPCVEASEHETSVTLDCTVHGAVNPEGVSETEFWLEWGKTSALGEKTLLQPVLTGSTPVPVQAEFTGVAPGETLYYQFAGYDKNSPAPELLTSEQERFQTPAIPPRIVGQPSVSFVKSESVVMFGVLNPENTPTRYEFQYGPCQEDQEQKCATSPYPSETVTSESSVYAKTSAVIEATELQPSTLYHYRLIATNEANQTALNETGQPELPEGAFTTARAPVPQAQTGPVNTIGLTSALITGTADPNGQAATYAFELGTYNPTTSTQYGTVLTASAGSSTTPIEETLQLSDLQPSTTYAYRIKVTNGYGTSYGQPATFTTAGLPAALTTPAPLPMLATPCTTCFPKTIPTPKPETHTLSPQARLTRALNMCKKKPKSQRQKCEQHAHQQYKHETKHG